MISLSDLKVRVLAFERVQDYLATIFLRKDIDDYIDLRSG